MNTLRTNEMLKTPDSEALVIGDDSHLSVGSISVSALVALLKQGGDVLTYEFKRMSKERKIVTRSYSFDRSEVLAFIESNATDYAKAGLTNAQAANALVGW